MGWWVGREVGLRVIGKAVGGCGVLWCGVVWCSGSSDQCLMLCLMLVILNARFNMGIS